MEKIKNQKTHLTYRGKFDEEKSATSCGTRASGIARLLHTEENSMNRRVQRICVASASLTELPA
ncbi:hypothetical protein DRO54_06460 [Candidatus Bathyarchaeota archaeon]|nr:MAG: hypothetical protein DRO54_06460 [Candidatus Bathyarchaeota archaeon]